VIVHHREHHREMIITLGEIPQPNNEEVKHREPNTSAFLKQNNIGKGTLFVAQNRLSWMTDNGQGFSLEYPNISLHAVSKDLNNFPAECLYLMVDDPNASESESDDDDNGSSKLNEIRFVPDDKNSLEMLFKAMSECQLLHPDPNDSISEEEDDDDDEHDDIYEDAEEIGSGESGANRGIVYDVDAAERLLGAPDNQTDRDNYANGDSDEPMEVAGQFEDAEPEH